MSRGRPSPSGMSSKHLCLCLPPPLGCTFPTLYPTPCAQVLHVTMTKMNKRFGMAKMRGEAFVGENLVCEADLTLVLVK